MHSTFTLVCTLDRTSLCPLFTGVRRITKPPKALIRSVWVSSVNRAPSALYPETLTSICIATRCDFLRLSATHVVATNVEKRRPFEFGFDRSHQRLKKHMSMKTSNGFHSFCTSE